MRAPYIYSLLFCLLALRCGGSPRMHQTVELPDQARDTGSVTLVFSSKARGLVVAVNGKLVVEGANLRRLHIARVSSGYADIAIATEGVDRQMRVWVESGRDTSVPVAGPPTPPSQNPLLSAGLSVLAFLVSKAVTEALF